MEETCQCQSGTHGHEQGACPNAATEEDRLCKQCRDMTAADEAMQAIRSATDGANLPQARRGAGLSPALMAATSGLNLALFESAAQSANPEGHGPDLHAEMLARLDALERGMMQLGLLPPPIGHNRPPEDEVLSPEDRTAISNAIATLKAQPAQPAARPPEATDAVALLQSVARKVWPYLTDKAALFADEFVKSAGGELGKRVVQFPYWAALYFLLQHAINAAMTWLQALPAAP